MIALAKILPEDTVQLLVAASCIGEKDSDERAAAIDRETVIAKSKYPHLFRHEALPKKSQVRAALALPSTQYRHTLPSMLIHQQAGLTARKQGA